MIEGQCLCGAVYYCYHAEIEKTILCFCQHCRRAQGGIMGSNSPWHVNILKWCVA